jgi:hypothetical protein
MRYIKTGKNFEKNQNKLKENKRIGIFKYLFLFLFLFLFLLAPTPLAFRTADDETLYLSVVNSIVSSHVHPEVKK